MRNNFDQRRLPNAENSAIFSFTSACSKYLERNDLSVLSSFIFNFLLGHLNCSLSMVTIPGTLSTTPHHHVAQHILL